MPEGEARPQEQHLAGAPIARDRTRHVALAQGAFYVVTGIWPLVSMSTFEKVTGPKTDRWLVKTVGALIAVVGTTLIADARRRPAAPPASKLLGVGSAIALAAIDVIYASRGRISRIYLVDAAVELGIAGAWLCLGGPASRRADVLRRRRAAA
ncbi:hypothetical protein WME99_37190 [Sorangium sp. So ce136]|uniref:hypothetical protein n=1 Tax=Sorangium sp. So ce136 TaxID=3133284 RepID=UPI003F0D2A43